jgi:hypothetical protein
MDSTELVHRMFEAAQADTCYHLNRVRLQSFILTCFRARLALLHSMFSIITATNAISVEQIDSVTTEVVSKTTTFVQDQLLELWGDLNEEESTRLILQICMNVDMIDRFFQRQLEGLPPAIAVICERHITAPHIHSNERLFHVLGRMGYLDDAPRVEFDDVVPETPVTQGPVQEWPTVEEPPVTIKTVPGTPQADRKRKHEQQTTIAEDKRMKGSRA